MQKLFFRSVNTVVDTTELHRRAFNSAFLAAGLDWHWSGSEFAVLQRITGERHRIVWYAEHQKQLTLSCGKADNIFWHKQKELEKLLESDNLKPRPGILRLLDEANKDDISSELFLYDNNDDKRIIQAASRNIPAFSSISIKQAQVETTSQMLNNHANAAKGIPHQTTIAIDQCVITGETARIAGIHQRVVNRCFSIQAENSPIQTCISHLGDPNNPATHISGANILRQGVASLSSLSRLAQIADAEHV